jgi:hypothetical protein
MNECVASNKDMSDMLIYHLCNKTGLKQNMEILETPFKA